MKRGLTAADLHAALGGGVHMKTVKRDMEAVAAGFPDVRFETYDNTRILRIDHGHLLETLSQKPDIKKKRCVACRDPLPLSDFHNCRSYTDGLWPECKECRNKYNRMFYAANYRRERVTERDDSGQFVKTTGPRMRRKTRSWQ